MSCGAVFTSGSKASTLDVGRAYKLHDLRKCNRTLYMRPKLLRSLPTEEIAEYMRKCFSYGKATMYPTTSMYAVCVAHAQGGERRTGGARGRAGGAQVQP